MPRAVVKLSAQHYPYGECTEGLDPDGQPIEGATACGKGRLGKRARVLK